MAFHEVWGSCEVSEVIARRAGGFPTEELDLTVADTCNFPLRVFFPQKLCLFWGKNVRRGYYYFDGRVWVKKLLWHENEESLLAADLRC